MAEKAERAEEAEKTEGDDQPQEYENTLLHRQPLPPPPPLPLTHPHPVEARYGRHPLLREPVGRAVSRDPLLLGDLEDAKQRLVDLTRLLLGPLHRPAVQLAVDVDDAAPVDHIIRRIQNPPLLQLVAMP